jgi:hypothetical protein
MKFPPRCDRWRVLRYHLCGSFPPATPTLKSRCARAHPTSEKQQQPQKQRPLRGLPSRSARPFALRVLAPPRYARSPQKAPLEDLSVCYPRLRQEAFGMYMPRFNADVQMQMPKREQTP